MIPTFGRAHTDAPRLVVVFIIGLGLLLPYVNSEPAPVDVWAATFILLIVAFLPVEIRGTWIALGSLYVAMGVLPGVLDELQRFDFFVRQVSVEAYLVALVIVMAGVARTYRATADLLVRWIAIGAIVSAVATILLLLTFDPSWIYRDATMSRLKGTFEDPNVLAPFMVIPIAVLAVARGHWATRLALAAPCLVLVVLAGSRGGYVAFIVTIAALVCLRLSSRMLALGIVGAFTTIWVVIAIGPDAIWRLFLDVMPADLEGRFGVQQYDDGRFANFVDAWNQAFDSPFGIGAGQYSLRFGTSPHNLFLGKAVDAGLVAAILLVGFLVAAVLRTTRLARQGSGDVTLVIAALLWGQLASSVFIYSHHWRHMLILAAVGLAMPPEDPAPTTERVDSGGRSDVRRERSVAR